MSRTEVFGLFPIPVLRVTGVLDERLVEGLLRHFEAVEKRVNESSAKLSHTQMLVPGDSPLLVQAAAAITPRIVELGAMLFGQHLGWSIKEMWVNFLQEGGQQAMHNHANSFVSGIVYLTACHPGAQTLFLRPSGGTDFVFRNENADVAQGPFNADRWVAPAPAPGDLLLFPSYLLHAVPVNPGGRRITMSFNAIPGALDSWGYRVLFNA